MRLTTLMYVIAGQTFCLADQHLSNGNNLRVKATPKQRNKHQPQHQPTSHLTLQTAAQSQESPGTVQFKGSHPTEAQPHSPPADSRRGGYGHPG